MCFRMFRYRQALHLTAGEASPIPRSAQDKTCSHRYYYNDGQAIEKIGGSVWEAPLFRNRLVFLSSCERFSECTSSYSFIDSYISFYRSIFFRFSGDECS